MTMTKLQEMFAQLNESDKEKVLTLAQQMTRAHALGLAVQMDESRPVFHVVDPLTGRTITPRPLTLEALTAWIDDYKA